MSNVGDAVAEGAADAADAAGAGLRSLASALKGAQGVAAETAARATGPSTPLATFVESTKEGFAFVKNAADQGQWGVVLTGKPFKGLAAVTLTIVRIASSWFLSGVEYACAMLYSTPAYVAVIIALALNALNNAAKASAGAAAPAAAAAAAEAERIAAEKAIAKAKKEEEEKEAAALADTEGQVESAMNEEDQRRALARVMDAKTEMAARGQETYNDAFKQAYTPPPPPTYVPEYVPPPRVETSGYQGVDQSEVERIYAELTSKYALDAPTASSSTSGYDASSLSFPGLSSSATTPASTSPFPSSADYGLGGTSYESPYPSSLPSSETPASAFDADEFLNAFSATGETAASYAPPARVPKPRSSSAPSYTDKGVEIPSFSTPRAERAPSRREVEREKKKQQQEKEAAKAKAKAEKKKTSPAGASSPSRGASSADLVSSMQSGGSASPGKKKRMSRQEFEESVKSGDAANLAGKALGSALKGGIGALGDLVSKASETAAKSAASKPPPAAKLPPVDKIEGTGTVDAGSSDDAVSEGTVIKKAPKKD
jgi:hypothetical protein